MTPSIADMRKQLLANLKFLYGESIGVLTLAIDDNPATAIQAIAATSDQVGATLTKHLHGRPTYSYDAAIENLLWVSEKQIGKVFSASGNKIPFEGDMLQILALGSENQEIAGSPTSQQSEFTFIPTAGSSLADETALEVSLDEGTEAERHITDEDAVGKENYIDVRSASSGTFKEKGEIVNQVLELAGLDLDQKLEEVDEWGSFLPKESPKLGNVIDAKVENTPQVVAPEPIIEDFGWGSPFTKKTKQTKKKQKKARFTVDELACKPNVEPEPDKPIDDNNWASFAFANSTNKVRNAIGETEEPARVPEAELAVDDGVWGSYVVIGSTKKGKHLNEEIIDPAVATHPGVTSEPTADEESNWGVPVRKDRKKKKLIVSEEVLDLIEEPNCELEPVNESIESGSSWTKKDKKKSKKVSSYTEETVEAPALDLEPIIEIDDWAPLSISKRDKKKKNVTTTFIKFDEEPILDPELTLQGEAADEIDDWAPTPKKDKKKKKSIIYHASLVQDAIPDVGIDLIPETEPEPLVEEDFWARGLKREKKKQKIFCFESLEPVNEQMLEPEPISEFGPAVPADAWAWGGYWRGPIKKDNMETKSSGVPDDIVQDPTITAIESKHRGAVIIPEKTSAVGTPLMSSCDPPEGLDEDDWMDWEQSVKNGKKKKKMKETAATAVVKLDLLELDDISEVKGSLASEVPVSAEAKIFSPEPVNTQPEHRPVSESNSRISQSIVFTIRHTNLATKLHPLEVMLTLTNNTRTAIYDAVNAYLDSRDGNTEPRQRSLQIRSAVGRNGEVDLATLAEVMWPEYIEYFCQYTKLPELTIDVLDAW